MTFFHKYTDHHEKKIPGLHMLEKQISLKPVCVYYTGMTVFKVECAAAGNPSIFVQAFLFSF